MRGHGLAGAEGLLSTSAREYGKRAPHPTKLAGTCGEQQLRDAVLAVDVVFELFDYELLLGNNRLDEIAKRSARPVARCAVRFHDAASKVI